MADGLATVHVALEKHIVPKARVGVQISVAGAILLVLFLPGAGMVKNYIDVKLAWILSLAALSILICGIIVVVVLPAWYRNLSKLVSGTAPVQMKATLRIEQNRMGDSRVFADLREFESEPDDEIVASVRVMNSMELDDHSTVEVYGSPKSGMAVIKTVNGYLWPEPDERQKRLEETFRVR